MDELSVLDLQNLRHLIGGYETSHKKMMEYASGASDPQIKQFFRNLPSRPCRTNSDSCSFPLRRFLKMIDEKTMVADTLVGINGELTRFGEMIPQTENKQLKQTLKQLRNACETSQEEIYQLARAHQYYVPAEKASTQEIQHVKNILTQG